MLAIVCGLLRAIHYWGIEDRLRQPCRRSWWLTSCFESLEARLPLSSLKPSAHESCTQARQSLSQSYIYLAFIDSVCICVSISGFCVFASALCMLMAFRMDCGNRAGLRYAHRADSLVVPGTVAAISPILPYAVCQSPVF